MKPPVPYYGGKARLAPWIVSLLPPHRAYIEPFAGSLAVLFAKQPAVHEVVNDIDSEVVTFFRVLRDRPGELADAVALTPYARDEFRAAIPDESINDLERARRWWVRVNQGFNKGGRLNNGWSTSIACGNGEPKSVQNRLVRLRACADRLMGVTIENRDAIDVIDAYGVPGAVIYADPPYVLASRAQGLAYPHEMASEADHRRLADALHDTPATVVLSGYPSDLYDEIYGDWYRLEQRVVRRSSNKASGDLPQATEVLWANRDLTEGRLDLLALASGEDG